MFYLDCDTTPPLRSSYTSSRTTNEAVKRATTKISKVLTGQIGVYENHLGRGFKGYVIKHAGEEPYFEAATE